eukprot:gene483-7179_t
MDNSQFVALLSAKANAKAEAEGKAKSSDSAEERARKKAKQQASYERRMAIEKRRKDALTESSRYVDRAA